jgi:NADH-quinone oxidoreductase subunit M
MFGLAPLSTVVWLPIVAGVIVLLVGSDRNAAVARWLALVGALAGLAVALPLWTGFDRTIPGMQFEEFRPWIATFNINYHFGIDGVSLLLILLNCFTTVLVVIAGWTVIRNRVSQYMAAFLILSGMMNGVFSSLDAALFYVFFEATLIPMFIIIGVWGGANRVYASVKFFLYTFLGSLLTLVALIYLYNASGGSFSLLDYYAMPIPLAAQILVFLAFFAAFAVKVPMWPVHTWLPDAHVSRPIGDRTVVDRSGVHRPGGSGAGRYEEADRVLIDLPHGFCHAWNLYIQPAWVAGRSDSDGVTRIRFGRFVFVRGRTVRPYAFALDL